MIKATVSKSIGMPDLPPTSLATIHHLGYVVTDLAAAARQWHDIGGVGPFLALEHVPFDEITSDGAPAVYDHTASFAACGSLFFELQLVHNAEPQSMREHFRADGLARLNHVSYAVDDAAAESARLAALGMPAMVRARWGDLNIVLHDAPALGFAVEIHQDSDFLRGFFQQVRQASEDWDGKDLIHFLPG